MSHPILTPLHTPGHPLVLVNVWDAGSARIIAEAGAPALATASWAVAASHGLPDGENITLDALLTTVREIVATVDLPVTVDLEAGHGAAPADVARTIELAIAAGAAGANLEDGLAEGSLRPLEDQVERLRAARVAADGTGRPFHLNARTDVWLLPTAPEAGDTEEALRRLRAYAAAGADSVFVPGLGLGADLDRVIAEQPLPVNVMRLSPLDPPTADLAAAGVARISSGPGPWRAAMDALATFATQAG